MQLMELMVYLKGVESISADETLYQQGCCSVCNSSLISFSKRSFCPVCGTNSFLT